MTADLPQLPGRLQGWTETHWSTGLGVEQAPITQFQHKGMREGLLSSWQTQLGQGTNHGEWSQGWILAPAPSLPTSLYGGQPAGDGGNDPWSFLPFL